MLVTHDASWPRAARASCHGKPAGAVTALRLALRLLAREWRSGELGVLLLALTVAVAALTGVGFLVSRISAAVALQASEVLAADCAWARRSLSMRPTSRDAAGRAAHQPHYLASVAWSSTVSQPADERDGGDRRGTHCAAVC